MTTALCWTLYACAGLFAAATGIRAAGYARHPIHLRWELYPVPHESPDKVPHGGSRYEDSDWWTRDPKFNLIGELRFMLAEMLFLRALHEFNRKLWYRSFPFHFGLYLLALTCGLLLLTALLTLLAPARMAGPLALGLHWAYTGAGVTGAALASLGAVLLLLRRLTDPALKAYTTPGDVFNLLFFLSALGFLAAGYFARPEGSPGTAAIALGLLTFDGGLRVPGLLAAGLLLSGLLAAYIPLTHMSHFVGKWFTYHAVRWNDAPNLRGGALERKLTEHLTYRPTWAAPHVKADGKKTWAEVATTNPWQAERKP